MRLFTVTVFAVSVIVACGGSSDPPVFDPLPQPTVPPGYISYTSESSLFSIYYPPDWELTLSLLPELEAVTNEILESRGLEAIEGGSLFFAGKPIAEGFLPNVSVIVESVPGGVTIEEYNEFGAKLLEEESTGYRLISTIAMQLPSGEAMLNDFEVNASSLGPGIPGKAEFIQLTTIDGQVAWIVTCTLLEERFTPENRSTCNSVLRSFSILLNPTDSRIKFPK